MRWGFARVYVSWFCQPEWENHHAWTRFFCPHVMKTGIRPPVLPHKWSSQRSCYTLWVNNYHKLQIWGPYLEKDVLGRSVVVIKTNRLFGLSVRLWWSMSAPFFPSAEGNFNEVTAILNEDSMSHKTGASSTLPCLFVLSLPPARLCAFWTSCAPHLLED